jgi:hypothetical protein
MSICQNKTEKFEYQRQYIKDGENKFDEIVDSILKNKPNWVKFVIEYVGMDEDPRTS